MDTILHNGFVYERNGYFHCVVRIVRIIRAAEMCLTSCFLSVWCLPASARQHTRSNSFITQTPFGVCVLIQCMLLNVESSDAVALLSLSLLSTCMSVCTQHVFRMTLLWVWWMIVILLLPSWRCVLDVCSRTHHFLLFWLTDCHTPTHQAGGVAVAVVTAPLLCMPTCWLVGGVLWCACMCVFDTTHALLTSGRQNKSCRRGQQVCDSRCCVD